MLDIEVYRIRIGTFNLRGRSFCCNRFFQLSFYSFLLRFLSVAISYTIKFFKDLSRTFILLSVQVICLRLMLSGGVELNPGPLTGMLKIVCGTFNQGAIELFGSNAGKQCTCNAITALAWTSIRRVGIWKSSDLDRILLLLEILCIHR